MKDFNLFEISDRNLDSTLKLSDKNFSIYIGQIIEKFYPDILPGTTPYDDLVIGYHSSFEAEKLIRTNITLHKGFRVVYTKTGLIRNLINQIYFNRDDLIVH